MRTIRSVRKAPLSVLHCTAAFITALGAWGCDDPLKRVDLVSEARVLGARVEVEGEPERASPAPGETARVRWLVADPELDPPLGWAFAVCEAAPPGASLPSCAGAPFAVTTTDVPEPGEPFIEFAVPDDVTSRALAVYGIVCPDSAPTLEADSFGCEGPNGTPVSLDFELATPERANRNPVIGPDALTLDGEPLAAGFDCATLPEVAPGSSHSLELALEESDRDSVEPEIGADPTRETLQVSNFITAGSLDRVFTVIEATDDRLTARASWKAPKTAPEGGLARFFVVVRDLRGGADWSERAVCVGP